MSAKNAIVILKTKSNKRDIEYEYRIAHCGNINELYDDDFEIIKNFIRTNFITAPINTNEERTEKNAQILAKKTIKEMNQEGGVGYLELGIIKYDLSNRFFHEFI